MDARQFDLESDKIFQILNEETLKEIKENSRKHTFKKGNLIFYDGGEPSGVYWIESGKVKAYKTGIDDKEHIFYLYNAGDLFGYHTIFTNEIYDKSASALEETTVYIIPRKFFLDLFERFPELKDDFIIHMAHEFKVLLNYLTFMSQFEVRERLALSLLGLNRSYYDPNTKKSEIAIPREDLANIIGTSRESLSRLLKQFKEDRLIKMNARNIIILKPEKLQYISNSVYEVK
mgnify:CR=1 FL=1